MEMNTICYKMKTGDEFLAYYTYKNDEEAKNEAEKLNTEKPAKLWNGQPIDWEKIDHFFVNKQEEMY